MELTFWLYCLFPCGMALAGFFTGRAWEGANNVLTCYQEKKPEPPVNPNAEQIERLQKVRNLALATLEDTVQPGSPIFSARDKLQVIRDVIDGTVRHEHMLRQMS